MGYVPELIDQMSKGKIYSEILAEKYRFIDSRGFFLYYLLYESVEEFGPVVKFQMLDKIMIHTVDPDSIKV